MPSSFQSILTVRYMHNNGWFVVRSPIPENATVHAIEWVITPHAVAGWKYGPVVQVSQIGYHPAQSKTAIIELNRRGNELHTARLVRIMETGEKQEILVKKPEESGQFLQYRYVRFDFSSVSQEGMYMVEYNGYQTHPFKIAEDVYKRHVWQPTLEYFLPVQMCHMRVNEKYRVWHGLCHMDDARMAPLNHIHFDGHRQDQTTHTGFIPGEHVTGLNTGGWHDAGDYDLRVESQSGEIYILTMIWEAFHVLYDDTYIDQETRIVEIHQPDGKPDVLQQIEHGALAIISGYRNLGRLYRGIICSTLRQYVLLGDGSVMTDGTIAEDNSDDRWVFTEDNPRRELQVAAHLAAASRALRGFNDTLSDQCLRAAEEIFHIDRTVSRRTESAEIHAAIELLLTTRKEEYKDYLIDRETQITGLIDELGWLIGRALPEINDARFSASVNKAIGELYHEISGEMSSNPYGIPYHPRIWGAAWDIERFGVQQYYLHTSFPDVFPETYLLNALNFVLGVHPGSNTSSLASGVGARSTTVAYGVNRADWSYIPGGVSSGTGLIHPDFPELLDFPYLWQQQEYCIGGPATNFAFLVLAADQLAGK
jgi:endoglucanase